LFILNSICAISRKLIYGNRTNGVLHARQRRPRCVLVGSFIFGVFCGCTTAKVSEEVNRKLPAYSTTFSRLHRPWAPRCTALQRDRHTHTQTYTTLWRYL